MKAATHGTIHGLGGVGKSTLALHYAHRYRGDYTLIWWINAASPAEIETSLTGLTHTLVPDWAATADRAAQVAWTMQWLAWHPHWLLVYDNVEHPDDLAPYTGALHKGHHLATSRLAIGWPDNASSIALGNLDPDDATTLLCRITFKEDSTTASQKAEARSLAAELGYLPLAIKQAGAYLAQNRGISLRAYRSHLSAKLDKTAHGARAERAIARIWDVTLESLGNGNRLALEVLYTAVWLAPDDIPHNLLAPLGTDTDDLAEAIGTLAAYSMVTDTGTAVTVHRLVQTVLRTRQNPADARSALRLQGRNQAEQAVLRGLTPLPHKENPDEENWDTFTPHLVTLAATRLPELLNPPLADAYAIAAQRLCEQGHSSRAVPLFEATLAHREQVLGQAHPETLTSRNDLATACHAAGDLDHAIRLLKTTLAQRTHALGDTHRDTLKTRHNLALAFRAAGKLDRAIPLLEHALTQSIQTLGNTDPDTLANRGDLAWAYKSAGDLRRAIPLYEATLSQCEHTLGDTHPHTLTIRHNLATAHQAAGDPDHAIPLYEATHAQRNQILGSMHPETLITRNNLASGYLAAGDLDRAIQLHEATLTDFEETFGDTHPDTLTSRSNLAYAYNAAGYSDRAIPLHESTLAQREQILGDAHPDTLKSRGNLANAYQASGDLNRAIALHESTLAQREQLLGDTHPDTLKSRHNLANAYQASGDLNRAIPLLGITLAQRQKILGNTHPDTLKSHRDLARARAAVMQQRDSSIRQPASGLQPPSQTTDHPE
ncbi:tetratricopeptide repeat protein [Streptomyces sp. NPDC060235]|uniref:tetratricopeptide repeat protein n=1 Tax=Streptomyces sp. NPDC060235 TaxID=3347080 RepID=UPI003667948D